MDPKTIVMLMEALVTLLLKMKANGELADEQLDEHLAATNENTRNTIKAFLAGN